MSSSDTKDSVTGSSPTLPNHKDVGKLPSQLQSLNSVPRSSNPAYGANEGETKMTRTYESIQDQQVSLVDNIQRGESLNGISASNSIVTSV